MQGTSQGQGGAARTSRLWKRSQPAQSEKAQTKSVRTASMVQREAPDRFLVTLIPKKLKKAIETTLPKVVTCSCREQAISCSAHTPSAAMAWVGMVAGVHRAAKRESCMQSNAVQVRDHVQHKRRGSLGFLH